MVDFKVCQGNGAQRAVGQGLFRRGLIEKGDAAVPFEQGDDGVHIANLDKMGEVGDGQPHDGQTALQYGTGARARLSDQDAFAEQILSGANGSGKVMAGGAHGDIRHTAVDALFIIAGIAIPLHHGEVDAAVVQIGEELLRVAVAHPQVRVGMAVDEGGHGRNEIKLADGHRHAEGQPVTAAERSEERRVGKECRSRWSPYH